MDAYEEHPNSALCYMFFLSATFLIQITALNMLIALMGDTFDRVIELRPVASRQNKLRILLDMANCIDTINTEINQTRYLYIIESKDNKRQNLEGGENWRGKLFFLQEIINDNQNKNEAQVKEIKQFVENIMKTN